MLQGSSLKSGCPWWSDESGKRVKAIRSDRGGGSGVRSWLKRHGIKQQLTTAYTPQSTAWQERANRTIIEGGENDIGGLGVTEVSHDLGGAEGEAVDVEEVLQQGEAPIAERGDTDEEVQQPTPSPKLPSRRTTKGSVMLSVVEPRKEQPRRGPRELPIQGISSNRCGGEVGEAQDKACDQRLSAEGGNDFQEVFAPVAKAPTLRLLLAAAAVCGWKVEQMDVKTAFLYGMVDEEIYMKQPEGYDDGIGRRVRREFFMTEGEEEKVFLLVYVDDILLFSPFLERIKEVQGKLKETFQCKALGPVGITLVFTLERDEVKGWLRLHQHKYLAAMGEKYGLEEGRSVKTPYPQGFSCTLMKRR
ncbi:unnamed protein product, partial [Closterium sp. NIES-65]